MSTHDEGRGPLAGTAPSSESRVVRDAYLTSVSFSVALNFPVSIRMK